jgi:hypothetical protein
MRVGHFAELRKSPDAAGIATRPNGHSTHSASAKEQHRGCINFLAGFGRESFGNSLEDCFYWTSIWVTQKRESGPYAAVTIL